MCLAVSSQPIARLTPFGGPTFMVLNLASHSLPLSSLSSSLALLSESFLSSTLPIFLQPPIPPVQHNNFCQWHLTHTLRSSPPLVQEKHLIPFIQHQLYCTVLALAGMTMSACFGMQDHFVLGVLPLTLVVWLHGGTGASLGSLSSLISFSPSSSAVISSSLGLPPLPRLAFIPTRPFI